MKFSTIVTKMISGFIVFTFSLSNSISYSSVASNQSAANPATFHAKTGSAVKIFGDVFKNLRDQFNNRPEPAGTRSELRSDADVAHLAVKRVIKTVGTGKTETIDMSKYEGPVGSGKIINPRSMKLIATLMSEGAGDKYNSLMQTRYNRLAGMERGEIIPGGKGDVEMDMIVKDAYGGEATVREILEGDWQGDAIPEPLTKAGAILTGPWTPMMGISAISGREITDLDRKLYEEVLTGLQQELPADLVAAIEKVVLRKPDGQIATTQEKMDYVKGKLANIQNELVSKQKVVPVRIFADIQDARLVAGDGMFEMFQTVSNVVNGNQEPIKRARDGKVYRVPRRSEWPVITVRIDDFDVSDRHITYKGKPIPSVITSLVFAIESIYEALENDRNQAYSLVIPKTESPEELVYIIHMKQQIEQELGIKQRIPLVYMNETIEAAVKLNLILWAGRHDVKITNVGRWDKGAADMRTFWFWLKKTYGNLAMVDMFKTLMDTYVRGNLVIAKKHGFLPEGGMVTVMPSEGNLFPDDDRNAIKAIVVDKLYEWLLGYDYAWVASPSYLPLVQVLFQQKREFTPELEDRPYADETAKLLEFPEVPLDEAGLYADVYELITYAFGYRNTGAAVAIDNLKNKTRGMFDGATGKKVNYHLWTLVRAAAKLSGKDTAVTPALLDQMIEKVMADKGDRYRQFVPQSELDIAKILGRALINSKNLVFWEKELFNTVVDDRDPAVVQKKVDEWLAQYNAEQDKIFNAKTSSAESANETALRAQLQDIAKRMVPANGGILAADESTGSAKKRLDSVGLENTYENRELMRRLMLTVPGQETAGINSVILYEETFKNVDEQGRNLVQHHLLGRGIVPGIKTDKGLIPDPDSEGEELPNPKGLAELPEMLKTFKAQGALFTKWRVVIHPDVATDANIRKNMKVLAQSAKMTQLAGLVPIVEPEVLMEKGTHNINTSYQATTRTLEILFEELAKEGVWLDGVILKTSMILSGQNAENRADAETVGFQTLKALLKTVPAEVPAIVFLSGGQGDDEVNQNMDAVSRARLNKFEQARDQAATELEDEGKSAEAAKVRSLTQAPWDVSYSFGRGLQRPGLQVWQGKSENFEAAQAALLQAAQTTQAARLGNLKIEEARSELRASNAIPEDARETLNAFVDETVANQNLANVAATSRPIPANATVIALPGLASDPDFIANAAEFVQSLNGRQVIIPVSSSEGQGTVLEAITHGLPNVIILHVQAADEVVAYLTENKIDQAFAYGTKGFDTGFSKNLAALVKDSKVVSHFESLIFDSVDAALGYFGLAKKLVQEKAQEVALALAA